MLAGFAEREFTPKEGNMPGYFTPTYAVGTIGGLFANAAAITNGDTSVILISMDVLSFKDYYADAIKKRISDATGVPTENILIAAIHSHTATPTEYPMWNCPADLEITAHNADMAVEAAVAAWNSRESTSVCSGRAYNDKFNFCRDFIGTDGNIRTNPYSKSPEEFANWTKEPAYEADHSVDFMRIDDEQGNPKCFMVNYANHPDCCTNKEYKGKFSADYPGYLRRALKAKYGDDVIVLFFLGTSGDVNCFDNKNKTSNAYVKEGKKNPPEAIGEGLAADIIAISDTLKAKERDPFVQVNNEHIVLKRRVRTEKQYQWALELSKTKSAEELTVTERDYIEEYLTPVDQIPKTVEFEMQFMQIGPWAFVGIPGEVYTEIGVRIKEGSPYENTLIFTLANGTNGYLATDRTILSETSYAHQLHKFNSHTDVGTADILVNESLKSFRKMKENEEKR